MTCPKCKTLEQRVKLLREKIKEETGKPTWRLSVEKLVILIFLSAAAWVPLACVGLLPLDHVGFGCVLAVSALLKGISK